MESLPRRVGALLGFAQAAGKIASGEEAARLALRRGKGRLVIVAADASPATQKRFRLLAERMRVPHFVAGTRESLGAAIGKAWRSVVVVMDPGFASTIRRAIDGEEK